MGHVRHFTSIVTQHANGNSVPLSPRSLTRLRRRVLNDGAIVRRCNIHRSPIFISRARIGNFGRVIRCVTPPTSSVTRGLGKLRTFVRGARKRSTLVHDTITSFTFICVRPLTSNGNQMRHFLVGSMLEHSRVVRRPVVLPVSRTVTRRPSSHRTCSGVLSHMSIPLVRRVHSRCDFSGRTVACPSNVHSGLGFRSDRLVRPT